MSGNEPLKALAPRVRRFPIAICLLGAGMALAIAGNVYQFVKQRHFEHDVDLMQRSTEHQMADLKEAVSGVLEQNLLRYDELSKQIQSVSSSTLEQAKSEVKKNTSELARALDRRHRDLVTQLSDMRADLRQDTVSKLNKISADLQNTHSDLRRVATQLDTMNVKVETNSDEIKSELAAAHTSEPAPQEQAAPPPKPKKQFWSKLNPFKSSKRKQEVSETDVE